MNKILILLVAVVVVTACNKKEQASAGKYPFTKKVDQVDTLSGAVVKDAYPWVENDTSRETAQWVADENQVTNGYLKNIPFHDAIRKRLDELQNYERLSAPAKHGENYYYPKNSGLQNHNVIYRKKGEAGAEELFIDPNTFSTDGTTALGGTFYTTDGSMVALLIQEGGSDWRKAVVLNTKDKAMVGD